MGYRLSLPQVTWSSFRSFGSQTASPPWGSGHRDKLRSPPASSPPALLWLCWPQALGLILWCRLPPSRQPGLQGLWLENQSTAVPRLLRILLQRLWKLQQFGAEGPLWARGWCLQTEAHTSPILPPECSTPSLGPRSPCASLRTGGGGVGGAGSKPLQVAALPPP